jgi:hypothetical protein
MIAKAIQGAVSPRRVVVLAVVAAISLVLFMLSSLATLNPNDFMYAAAPAVWAQNGALYSDVPFPQAPLSILLNSMLATVTGNVNIFLPGRVVSMILAVVAVLLPVLNRAKMENIEIWVLYVALCLTSLYIISNSGEIGNYSLSLLCVSAAVTAINAPGNASFRGFTACAFVGLAISAKLYFIILCPALFLYFVLNDRSARDPVVIAACGLGFVLGVLPVLYFLARDYQSFWRWTIHFFQLILPLRLKPTDAVFRIASAVMIFVVLMAIPIGFFIAAAWQAWTRGGTELREKISELLLLAAAAAMAISPIFVYEQYFAPLVLLLFLFSAPWSLSTGRTRRLYVICAGALWCMQSVILAKQLGPEVFRQDNVVTQVLAVQKKARQVAVNDYRCDRRVYTTTPLFLLENEIKYPPELVAAPFLMLLLRGDVLARKGEAYDLEAHMNKWSPDIVVWGYFLDSRDGAEDAVDRFVKDYAINRAFVVTSLGQVNGHEIKLGYRAGCKGVSRP